jgi:CHASE2 domain-containing sensor protein
VPAGAVARASGPRSDDLVRDRVVVIGSSHSEARDTYRTPIGDMPGAVILINAVKSLGAFGQVRAPSPLLKWTINIILILFMACIFSWLDSLLAEVLTGLVIVIVLLPLSFYFFKYGIWFDFAIPLLGMQLHHIVVELGDSYSGGIKRRDA